MPLCLNAIINAIGWIDVSHGTSLTIGSGVVKASFAFVVAARVDGAVVATGDSCSIAHRWGLGAPHVWTIDVDNLF